MSRQDRAYALGVSGVALREGQPGPWRAPSPGPARARRRRWRRTRLSGRARPALRRLAGLVECALHPGDVTAVGGEVAGLERLLRLAVEGFRLPQVFLHGRAGRPAAVATGPLLPAAEAEMYTGSTYSRPPATGTVTRLPSVTLDPPCRNSESSLAAAGCVSNLFCTCSGPRMAVSCGSSSTSMVP